MTKPRPILLATDGTSSSEPATAEAFRIALVLDAPLVVVCAAPMHGYHGAGEVRRDIERTLVQRMRAALAEVEARATDAGISCKTIAVQAAPIEAIRATAAASNPALVVVGTHGRGPFGRLMNGSVSRSLLEDCERPVLVVQDRKSTRLNSSH